MIAKIKYLKIILLFTVAITLSFASQKVDCIILKDNHFTYRNQGKDVLVIFKESEHVEYHNEKRFFIKWKKVYYKSTLAGKSWEGRLTKIKKLKE